MAAGLYQSFNYYDSDSPLGLDFSGPYRIAEAAAAGPAFSVRTTSMDGRSEFDQHFMLSAIAMGAVKTDYYVSAHRDYNFSSGWSLKSMTALRLRRWMNARLSADFFRFYSWKGYEKEMEENPDADLFYINTQGDESRASVVVVRPELGFRLTGGLRLDVGGTWFWRHTDYKYHEDTWRGNGEVRVGLSYVLR